MEFPFQAFRSKLNLLTPGWFKIYGTGDLNLWHQGKAFWETRCAEKRLFVHTVIIIFYNLKIMLLKVNYLSINETVLEQEV